MSKTRYEVQTLVVAGGWVNCWHENDEPLAFDTADDAQAAIDEFFEDLPQRMQADYSRDDYRVAVVADDGDDSDDEDYSDADHGECSCCGHIESRDDIGTVCHECGGRGMIEAAYN